MHQADQVRLRPAQTLTIHHPALKIVSQVNMLVTQYSVYVIVVLSRAHI